MDVEKLVFIDETWASTSMTRRYGRAPKGQRCIGSAPHGHWKTTTFVGGLRHDRLTAPMVAAEPMDGEMFLAWVQRFLCPTLQPLLRRAAKRTVEELWTEIGALLKTIVPMECANYFASSGYVRN